VKARTTEERIAGYALMLLGLAALATLPLWAPLAVVWLLATGRSLRSCNHEANRLSGPEE
jgi:fatty acid desaturase